MRAIVEHSLVEALPGSAGKPTSPHPTLISSVPGVLRALRQRWYEMTPEGAANSTSFKMEGLGSGGGSYALPYVSRKTTDAAMIDSIVWTATSGGTATVTTHSNDGRHMPLWAATI